MGQKEILWKINNTFQFPFQFNIVSKETKFQTKNIRCCLVITTQIFFFNLLSFLCPSLSTVHILINTLSLSRVVTITTKPQ